MGSKIKIKLKSDNYLSLLTKIYLKKSDGWQLVKKYRWFWKYIAVMTKEILNG